MRAPSARHIRGIPSDCRAHPSLSTLLIAAVFGIAHAPLAASQTLPTARPEQIGLSSTSLDRIAPALRVYADSGKVAGMVAVVVRHGKVGYFHSIGQMDVEHSVPMRSDAVFRIYSMTKPIIAVAVLRLYEQGKVQLNDPVSKFIPAFAAVKVYSSGAASSPTLRSPDRLITIEDLLTHTAGLTYGFFGATPVDSIYLRANLLDASRTVEQLADSIARLPLLFSPGTAWNYSMAMDVLGRLVEVASARPLDQFLEEEVFAPLGMTETTFHVRRSMEGRIPVLYSRGLGGRLRAPSQLLDPNYQPDGRLLTGGHGLLSTPSDYLRFAQMLLNGGELDGKRILKRETVALMTHNRLPATLTPIVSPMVGHSGYGQGFGGAVLVDSALDRLPGPPGIYRWWGYGGTFFWIDPSTDLIGMVWTQFIPGRTYPLEQDFQRLVYAALVKD